MRTAWMRTIRADALRAPLAYAVAGFVLAFAAGCKSHGERHMGLTDTTEPLNVALCLERGDEAADLENPFDRYAPLQLALGVRVGQPIAIEACYADQVFAGLHDAWYDFVVLTPVQYAMLVRLPRDDVPLDVLVMAVDKQGRPSRAALLLAPADSDVDSPGDLHGRRIAFGPRGNALTHHAAMMLLADAGIRPNDAPADPAPGAPGNATSLHLPRATEVLRAIAARDVSAGFVDELDWERFQQATPGEQPVGTPIRPADFRIIARTVALPPRLVLVSARVPGDVRRRARDALLRLAHEQPHVFDTLRIGGYTEPDIDALLACDQLLDYQDARE